MLDAVCDMIGPHMPAHINFPPVSASPDNQDKKTIGQMHDYGYGMTYSPYKPTFAIRPKNDETPDRSSKVYHYDNIDIFKSHISINAQSSEVLKIASMLPDGACIAGGSILSVISNAQINDIDVFVYNCNTGTFGDVIINTIGALAADGYTPDVNINSNDVNISNLPFIMLTKPGCRPVQLVKLCDFKTPCHVIDSFDLTIVQFALTRTEFVYNPMSMMDVIAKRMVFNRKQTSIQIIRRMLKYASKGYTCQNEEVIDTIKHIRGDAISIETVANYI